MAHVLIGFAEALPAPEVVFSLRAAGHRVSAFARNPKLPLARLPLEAMHQLPAPETDAADSVAALQALLDRENAPDLVLPLDDIGLWLTTQLPARLIGRIAGATGNAAAAALDKATQIRAARATGLSVPETVILPDEAGTTLPVPGIAKPSHAVELQSGKVIKGDVTFLNADWPPPTFKPKAALLVQPLIRGQGEGVFGFATASGVEGWSGHRRLRMMNPHGSGASACTSLPVDPAIKGPITKFLSRLEWRGPFMVELLRSEDDTPWFMELNGRMWGSMALARRQGLEYPAWSVAVALDPTFVPTPPPPPSAPLTLRHLGRELLHLAFIARGPKDAFFRPGWPRLGASIPAVLTPGAGHGYYNYDPSHPQYFLRDAVWTMRRAFRW